MPAGWAPRRLHLVSHEWSGGFTHTLPMAKKRGSGCLKKAFYLSVSAVGLLGPYADDRVGTGVASSDMTRFVPFSYAASLDDVIPCRIMCIQNTHTGSVSVH